MSTPPNPTRPPFSGRRRRPEKEADPSQPKMCRVCRTVPALPDDETCESCGQHAIERARIGVDTWLSMHAERVKELERVELARNERT